MLARFYLQLQNIFVVNNRWCQVRSIKIILWLYAIEVLKVDTFHIKVEDQWAEQTIKRTSYGAEEKV